MVTHETRPLYLQSTRLLGQLREVLRYRHYSLRTEEADLYWVGLFIRWQGRNGAVRHPRDMGAAEVQQVLSMLTSQRIVSVSTPNQALSALLFLYREVVSVQLPWLDDVQRPTHTPRIPSALTSAQVGGFSRHDRRLLVVREGIRTVQALLGHSDASTTLIYIDVLKVAAGGTASTLDALVP